MSAFSDFLCLFFPRTCAACGNSLVKREQVICSYCRYHLPRTGFHLAENNPVTVTFWGRIDLYSGAAFLYFRKGGMVQHLIHRFKYKGKKEIGHYLGTWYGTELRKAPLFSSVEVVIPVPLHEKKLKKRGFNQSEVFASGLADSLQVTISTGNLVRVAASATQTKKSRAERWENVKNIFTLVSPESLANKHVLLVDDVITTGATIESCAHALAGAKGIRISVVAIAMTTL